MALAYKEMGEVDKATKYIKRIVIWPSTNAKIKELYYELLKQGPKEEEKKEVKYINHNRNHNYSKASKNLTKPISLNFLKHKALY